MLWVKLQIVGFTLVPCILPAGLHPLGGTEAVQAVQVRRTWQQITTHKALVEWGNIVFVLPSRAID